MKINHNNVTINYSAHHKRITPDKHQKFKQAMHQAAKVVQSGLGITSGFISSPVLTAANLVSNGITPNGSNGENSNNNMNQLKSLQNQNQEWNMDFLKIQMELQAENRRYTTLSNIIKAKHDTSKSAINNMRV